MTSVPPDRRQTPFPEQLADWFQLNTKIVALGVVTIGAAALGYWFFTERAAGRAAAAEQVLQTARQAMGSQNAQLAANDLRRAATDYPDTRAGVEAALLLAESHYQNRQFAEGIEVLESFAGRGSAEVVRAKIYGLIGDGRLELKQPREAASDYARAAAAARFDGERAQYRGKEARALVIAGDTAAALKLWETLAESDAGGIAAEARVRAGELAAATGATAALTP